MIGEHGNAVSRVLVVDDDPDISRLVRVRLAMRGFRAESAASGEEALAAVKAEPPDLMFLDVALPGWASGLDVLDQVRSSNLDMAVIIMTAQGSEHVAVQSLRRGADDYLRKPFDAHEFNATLDRAVAMLTLRRQNVALRVQLDERHRQLEREMARAGAIQADLLPRAAPRLPGFELAARCVPAREVGGDFYDWQAIADGALTLTLGDVMGKGMPAALLMATVRTALRAVARHSPPAQAMDQAAGALTPDLDRSGSYVTLFHARLDTAVRCLEYVDAGHGHVFLYRADGSAEPLPIRGLPLGILEYPQYAAGSIVMAPGDALVVYSDGLLDACPDLHLDRVALATRLRGSRSAQEMVYRLITLPTLNDSPPDDLTVLVLRCSDAT